MLTMLGVTWLNIKLNSEILYWFGSLITWVSVNLHDLTCISNMGITTKQTL